MNLIIISIISVILYICIETTLYIKDKKKGALREDRHIQTIISVRLTVFLILFSVPLLAQLSFIFNSVNIAYHAESSVIVSAATTALIGLVIITQRKLAIKYGMKPALLTGEGLFLIIMSSVIYAVYFFTNRLNLEYLAPSFYCVYLVYEKIFFRD